MKKPGSKSKRLSQPQSQLDISGTFDEQLSDNISKEYVAQKRKIKKKQYTSFSNDLFEREGEQVLDIKRGDEFVREHIRPHFLKRWDSQSNILQLRAQEMQALSPMMKIYWQHKSHNMNCIIFVQFGKVEFLAFEDDAIRLHQIFKKPLKKFSSFLMVNFWSKEIQLAKIQLFQRKIPVLVLNEIEDMEYKEQFGIFKRQITEIITPSIFFNYESKQFRERIMLAVYIQGTKCGVVCIDIENNHFYIEQFDEKKEGGSNIHHIRRILNKYRPVEIIVQRKDNSTKKIAKQICQPYIIEMEPMEGSLLHIIKTMNELSGDSFFQRLISLYYEQYKQTNNERSVQFSFESAIKALSMVLAYMKNFTLETKIFGQAIFQIQNFAISKLNPMFDAQVYENLQVFSKRDQPQSFGQPGTLFHYLNKCVTNSGQKLLKKWIDNPLRTIEQIKQRQIAIQNLMNNKLQMLEIQKQLSNFGRLQKKVGDIYHWAISQREEGKIILTKQLRFDKDYDQSKNPAVQRLKQIYELLNLFKDVQYFLKNFDQFQFHSSLLNKICKIQQAGNLYRISSKQLQKIKLLPSIEGLVNKLKSNFHYNEQNQLIQPAQGLNEIFDMEKKSITEINEKLDKKLKQWKNKLNVSKAHYISVRARNQIEVPLSEVKASKFKQLIFSSQTSKFIRYVTAQTNQLSEELIQHEQQLARAYEPFCTMMVKEFCAHKFVWELYLSSLAKLDVLLSLSKVSKQMSPKTLPRFVDNKLLIEKGFHPGLIQIKKQQKVIGNSIRLEGKERILLLTGPNMGGKSTLLRQTCLLAIIAQIGCFVPAQRYEGIIFDQIFCRIGASDRILQGKSTFYVELQETKRIIDQATPQSLVIIDELGRGTSTFDGLAIASAVLKFIMTQIECFTLFSTHYFPITEQYLISDIVRLQKIGYYFNNEKIKFTYQLERGVAQKSFANQVATFVGISQQAIKIANIKAEEISTKHKTNKINRMKFDQCMEELKQFINQKQDNSLSVLSNLSTEQGISLEQQRV